MYTDLTAGVTTALDDNGKATVRAAYVRLGPNFIDVLNRATGK